MNKKILIVVVVALVVIVGGVSVFMLLSKKEDAEKEPVYLEYKFAEAYSNLKDGKSIVKYAITIKYDSNDEHIQSKLESNHVKLVDMYDKIMRATSAEELAEANGKEKLMGKIHNMIIDTLESDDQVIYEIYITPFIIQG